jgi:hypothetical protein
MENISKLKKTLKSPKRKNPKATFNKKKNTIEEEHILSLPELPSKPKTPTPPNIQFPKSKSPRSVSPKATSPRSVNPKPTSPRSVSPKATSPGRASPKTPTPPNIQFPKSKSPRSPKATSPNINLPGIPSAKTFDSRYAVMRPSIERFEENEIIKKNPKVSMQELSEILGVTRIKLPQIKTKLEEIPLPSIKVEKVKSPSRIEKKKSSSCDIMIGGKPVDKNMVSLERSSAKKPIYNVSELKEIGKQLGLSLSGPKDVLVISILKELESRGC